MERAGKARCLEMELKRICLLTFSPTGGTRRVGRMVAGELARRLDLEVTQTDFTRPQARATEHRFDGDELLVMASPVYAGRLPNKLLEDYRNKILGTATPAVPICVFGNRSPDEALRELVLLLEGNGFQIAGAAAIANRHAFSDRIGAGRPDGEDLAQMEAFADRVAEKLRGGSLLPLELDRGGIGPYYTPLRADGAPAKFLKAKPKTRWDRCDRCGLCAKVCPVGSIDGESMESTGLCIKCQACVRLCPKGAKYFDDPDFLSHVAMLEEHYARRAENTMLT